MKTAEPRSKRVIFNFSIDLVHELKKIPRGRRSAFVSKAVERDLQIAKRIRTVEAFDRVNKGIKVRRSFDGWGDVHYPDRKCR